MQRFVFIVGFLVACQAQRANPLMHDGAAPGSGGAPVQGAAGSAVDGSGGAAAAGGDAGKQASSCTRCGLSNVCCAADEQCVGERCLAPCDGTRCGDGDELCCSGATPLCAHKLCVAPGVECAGDSECAAMQVCEPLIERCLPGAAAEATCFQDGEMPVVPEPPVIGPRPFDAELLWEHTGLWASSMPLVVQLSDDNADGVVDDHDVPDVVVAARNAIPVKDGADTPLNYSSYLVALSGDDGRVLAENRDVVLCGDAPAAADLDGDGRVEIVATMCSVTTTATPGGQLLNITVKANGIAVFDSGLVLFWTHPVEDAQAGGVSIADLDADGTPEIIAPPYVFGVYGALGWTMTAGRGTVAIADLDLDGRLEVIWGGAVYKSDGTLLWDAASDPNTDTMPIVARVLFGYIAPQVALVSTSREQGTNAYTILVDVRDGMTGEALQGVTTLNGFSSPHASLPVLGDFDGIFGPDFGIGIGSAYVAIRARPDAAKPALIWSHGEPRDATYGAGSTAFDFDGDGTLEVVVASECTLRVLAAIDAQELWSAPSGPNIGLGPPAANWGLPVVADVDGDGHADLLVSSTDSQGWCDGQQRSLASIRVYREHGQGWTPARKLWNQYAYSIDNIADDGEVPRVPVHGWETHNTYRINRAETPPMAPVVPTPRIGMPDLRVSALSARSEHCPAQPVLLARIENQGETGVAEGVAVTFYEGGPNEPGVRLGAVRTRVPLLAGAATWVELGISDPPLGDAQTLRFFATVDESVGGASAVTECDELNNTTAPYLFACAMPSPHQVGGGD